jgi:hypothetical protein
MPHTFGAGSNESDAVILSEKPSLSDLKKPTFTQHANSRTTSDLLVRNEDPLEETILEAVSARSEDSPGESASASEDALHALLKK